MATAPAPSTSVEARLRAHLVARARVDQATFSEFVLRDEQTGQPITLAPMHEEQIALTQEHDRLVLWAAIEHGKSQLHTVGRTLFELGRDPSKRVAIVSNTGHQAGKFLSSVAQYITRSAELREVFPHLVPGPTWAPTTAITVKRRTIAKDPSVRAIGVDGNVLGARLDLVIMDDVLDFENTRTEEQRRKLIEWTHNTLLGRVVAGGRVVVLGVAQHRQDLMHELARSRAWRSQRFSATDDAGRPRWPQRWPAERIAAKREELGPMEAARQLDCLARSDEMSTFRDVDVLAAVERGRGRELLPQIYSVPPPAFVTVGVDLGASTKRTADLTAISTVLVHPNGHRELIAIESGRWSAPDIIGRINRANSAFSPSFVVVETVAAQAYVAQLLREWSAIPVVSYTTGRDKMSLEWQARALATELSNHKWTIRAVSSPEVHALVQEILYYDPRQHCGDRLASLLFARWGAERAGSRVEYLRHDFNRR